MARTAGTFYLDLVNGSDSARTSLTSCTASNPSGTITRITKNSHGLSNGMVVSLTAFSVSLNGLYRIENVQTNYFDLEGTAWMSPADTNGTVTPIGGSSWADAWKTPIYGALATYTQAGDVVRVAKSPTPYSIGDADWTNLSKTVTLETAQTLNVDMCESNWTGVTGIISAINVTPTNGGTGYTAGDILTITTGGGNAKVVVQTVSSGVVTVLRAISYAGSCGGSGYSTGTGQATSGGTGGGNCTVNVTTVINITSTLTAVATDAKEGSNCMKITSSGNVTAVNTKLAYYNIGSTLDLHTKQNLSYWLRNNITTAGGFKICLCSDTAGDTIVDEFACTAGNYNAWRPENVAKTGGGNLGSNIQSIAIYTVASVANPTIYLDDFIATATGGLNLQSLITKSPDEQVNQDIDMCYPIQSINGSTILIDNITTTKANAGRGYSGTTEHCATYARETSKVISAVSAESKITMNNSGTAGNNIQFQGGYNTSNDTQDGETIYDGYTGSDWQIMGTANYITFNRFNFVRVGSNAGSVADLTIDNMFITGCTSSFLGETTTINNFRYCNNTSYLTVDNRFKATNLLINNNLGTPFESIYYRSEIDTLYADNNATQIKIGGHSTTIKDLTVKNSVNYGMEVYGGRDMYIGNMTASGNTTATFYSQGYLTNLRIANMTTTDATPWANNANPYYDVFVGIDKLNTDTTAKRLYTDMANALTQTTERHTATGVAWQVNITNVLRSDKYPFTMPYKVAVAGSGAVTISVWVKLSSATDIGCKLVCYKNQVAGLTTDQISTATATTNWQQLSVSFTPTEAGVVEAQLQTYWLAGTADESVYVDDFGVTQV